MKNINFDPFPTLISERLILRKIENKDANEIFTLRSDERVMKFIDRPRAKSIEDARTLINKMDEALVKNEGITWGITLKPGLKIIGTIGYWRIIKEHFRAEIGYQLHFDLQGKGIMQEALVKVLDYGFNIMQLHSVEANVNPGNLPSIKLLEKNNFKREAYFKENYYFNGRFLDSAIYSLIKKDGRI
ncbi:MAG TPA: GNAT family protein [Chitinophagaceae bacterium]|jgi:ribosomal-protein-alanine N-acetyltransferase